MPGWAGRELDVANVTRSHLHRVVVGRGMRVQSVNEEGQAVEVVHDAHPDPCAGADTDERAGNARRSALRPERRHDQRTVPPVLIGVPASEARLERQRQGAVSQPPGGHQVVIGLDPGGPAAIAASHHCEEEEGGA